MHRSAISFAREQAAKESTSSRLATLASRFPSPADKLERAIHDICGRTLLERLIATVRQSAFARTSQGTFGWDSDESDEISNNEATAYRRAYLARLKLVRRNRDSGCSSSPSNWVCPTTQDAHRGDLPPRPQDTGIPLGQQVAMWPTPAARDHKGGSPIGTRNRTSGALDEAAEFLFSLPDPETATHGPESSPPDQTLPQQWPTPRAEERQQHNSADNYVALSLAVKSDQWDTPTAHDGRRPGADLHSTQGANLSRQVTDTPAKRLNPLFVEWLMNFPIGYTNAEQPIASTDFAQWAMLSSQLVRHTLSSVCGRQ